MDKYGGLPLIARMVTAMMPAVRGELARWRQLAERIPCPELRGQALASIDAKRFHCLGGGVFALYPGAGFTDSVRFIVALQTVSDYLDNLCDRAGVLDEAAFRLLHRSIADAVDPDAPACDYYALYPYGDDGGYLNSLVGECRRQMGKLASIGLVRERMKRFAAAYSELQALKHIRPALREGALKRWAGPLTAEYPGVSVWEYCAAAGSTLGIFLLYAAAQDGALTRAGADALAGAYFPWVCALHILLDYLIDAKEDRAEGDFNFTQYYRSTAECGERLAFIAGRAADECKGLGHPRFHATVIRGLLAIYLSDPKARSGEIREATGTVLRSGGGRAAAYRRICGVLRLAGKL